MKRFEMAYWEQRCRLLTVEAESEKEAEEKVLEIVKKVPEPDNGMELQDYGVEYISEKEINEGEHL